MASTEGGLSALLARQAAGFLVLWSVVAAWWIPAPLLVGVEEVDWGARYERAQAGGPVMPGAMELAAELIRRETVLLPLLPWIEAETGGRVLAGSGPGWESVLEEARRHGGRCVLAGDDPRLAEVAQGDDDSGWRYVKVTAERPAPFLELRPMRPGDAGHGEAPTRLRFPLRASFPLLLLVGVVAAFVTQHRPDGASRLANSTVGTGLKWSMGLLAGGVVAIAFPFVARLGANGIGLAVLGGFVLMTGLVALGVVGWHAVVVSRVLSGRDLLLNWVYEGAAWRQFADQEVAERSAQGRGLVVMAALIAAVIVGVFLAVAPDREAAGFAALFVAVAIALAALAAWAGVRAVRRRSSGPQVELFLGRGGLWLGGMSHVWRGFGARLESAAIVEAHGVTALEIVYSVLQSTGPRALVFYRRYETVRLPVPPGREAEAEAAVRELAAAGAR
jgi:hypothetical protein